MMILRDTIRMYEAEKKVLLHSNATYQRSRRNVTSQANMYETMSKALFNYITKRKVGEFKF